MKDIQTGLQYKENQPNQEITSFGGTRGSLRVGMKVLSFYMIPSIGGILTDLWEKLIGGEIPYSIY